MRWAERVVRTGEKRNADIILVGKPEGKRSLGRLDCRWKNKTKTDLKRTVNRIVMNTTNKMQLYRLIYYS
jgi:hypothetical protein